MKTPYKLEIENSSDDENKSKYNMVMSNGYLKWLMYIIKINYSVT